MHKEIVGFGPQENQKKSSHTQHVQILYTWKFKHHDEVTDRKYALVSKGFSCRKGKNRVFGEKQCRLLTFQSRGLFRVIQKNLQCWKRQQERHPDYWEWTFSLFNRPWKLHEWHFNRNEYNISLTFLVVAIATIKQWKKKEKQLDQVFSGKHVKYFSLFCDTDYD